MIYVVGSGPSGITAAKALLDLGKQVTMLDVGYQLEPQKQTVLNQLQNMREGDFPPQLLNTLRAKDTKRKTLFASDFPYRDTEQLLFSDVKTDVVTHASYAKGGLSQVWGSAVLPFKDEDCVDWPIKPSQMRSAYQHVLEDLPLSAIKDDLEEEYPLFKTPRTALQLSPLALNIKSRLQKLRSKLKARGIIFGHARLAVALNDNKKNCTYCNRCLDGCVYGLIYNTGTKPLVQLLQHPHFTYLPNVLVESLQEVKDSITIHIKDLHSNQKKFFHAERVFIGAGVYSSAQIILRSMQAYNESLHIKTNQHFVLPSLCVKNVKNVTQVKQHSMAQLFIELRHPKTWHKTVHLQLYTFSEHFNLAFKEQFGKLYRYFKVFIHRHLLGRFIVYQGFLHSEQSPVISVSLNATNNRLDTKLEQQANYKAAYWTAKQLVKKSIRLRSFPLLNLLRFSKPGEGAHIGGSFPMSQNPSTKFFSDIYGRPQDFKRLHLVDASVLPSLPATTITLTVMANAHRIVHDFFKKEGCAL